MADEKKPEGTEDEMEMEKASVAVKEPTKATQENTVEKEAAVPGEEQVSEVVDKAMYDELQAKYHALEAEAEALRAAGDMARAEKVAFDEKEVIKSLPAEAQEYISKMKAQKDAAEEQLRKAKEAEAEASAIAKAKELTAIPTDEATLIGVIKSADQQVIDLLTTINSAIEATVLTEVGKNKGEAGETVVSSEDAWTAIESVAKGIQEECKVSKEKAIAMTIEAQPELYANYIKQGGTK